MRRAPANPARAIGCDEAHRPNKASRMTSLRLRLASIFALSIAASLAPLGGMADSDSTESDGTDETEEVGSAGQAITLPDLAYRVVNIRNRWDCPSGSRCGQHMSWNGNGNIHLYPADNTADL